MFIARNLEFNAMTKYFYVDRTLPKARLSEPEMLEINRLYRIIGSVEAARPVRWTILAGLVAAMAGLSAVVFIALRSLMTDADHKTHRA